MNKAQEMYNIATNANVDKPTIDYVMFLFKNIEREAIKRRTHYDVCLSSIRYAGASINGVIDIFKSHGFDVSIEGMESILYISWAL